MCKPLLSSPGSKQCSLAFNFFLFILTLDIAWHTFLFKLNDPLLKRIRKKNWILILYLDRAQTSSFELERKKVLERSFLCQFKPII